MLTKNYKLDMVPGGVPLVVHVSQYDSDVKLVFSLFASSGTLSLGTSGVTAVIRGLKRDGNGYSQNASYAVADGVPTVTVQVTKQMTALWGKQTFEVLVKSSTGDLYSANFTLFVERSALDNTNIVSSSEIKELQDLAQRSDALIEAAAISEQTQANMRSLTERSEAAAKNAEKDANAASDAKAAAVDAKNTAVNAVDGFEQAVENKTEESIQTLEETRAAKVTAIQTSADQIKEAAESDINDARDAAIRSVNDTRDAANTSVNDTKASAMETINGKASEVVAIKMDADNTAAIALQTANSALNEVGGVTAQVEGQNTKFDEYNLSLAGKVDGGYVENDSLYLTSGGEVVAGPFTGFGGSGSGGGGGGATNTAVMTLNNTSGWVSRTVSKGSELTISLEWSSIEDEMPTGNGVLTVKVGGVIKAIMDAAQGPVTVSVSGYLSTGSNPVTVQVTDSYGNSRVKNFTISVVELSITSSYDDSQVQSGILAFPYAPFGAVQKAVHFILDGKEIGTVNTAVSGRQQNFIIPAQSHGAHTLKVYFEATVNGTQVRSNELYYEIIWLELLNMTPVIASSYAATSVMQYTTVNIPYTVYNPASQVSDVVIKIGDRTVSELAAVDRSQQVFSVRMDEPGEQTVTITSEAAEKVIVLNVIEAEIDVNAETQNLALYLSSASRSNNEADPAVWTFGNIEAEFSGFNWASDGWQIDKDGITALRVSGDARLTIPYQPFAEDFRNSGKTIEIEFATRDVLDYDAQVLSCLDDGRGIHMSAQACTLTSEQSSISMQFKEEEHVRVAFVVEKRSGFRRIYCYINGVMSGVVQYPDGDDFSQVNPKDISIGSDGCTVDLYCIRVYDNDLTSRQIEDNWIADTQDGALMLERYSHNNIRDEYGNVVISKLPSDLPYLILECEELPQYKGDKKTVYGSYTDPINPAKSFTFTGAEANVQGTSSQYYERKNYKIKFKGGIVNANGVNVAKYQMKDNAVPTNAFCFKADVASSEGANNVELAILYNDACVYKTPAQEQDPKVRQGIDGFPIVIFWHDTINDTTVFLGKYNFNNDKGTEEVFGFTDGDESWEVKNNTGDRVLYKSADYSGTDWQNDFEARFPDTDPPYTDPSQLAEFAAWVVSTDPEKATGRSLPAAVTYNGTEYTKDTAEYRKAKFRAELSWYVETDSALFYYLFTELFLMVDSRAKNMFPSFIGSEIAAG